MTVKITESTLKRIIREELERLAEAPKTLSKYYELRGQRLPSLAARRQLAKNLGLDPKTIGSPEGNTALLNRLLKADADVKAQYDAVERLKRANEKEKKAKELGPIEDRVIKMLQFYDTAVYGKSLGPFISKYNGLPGGPLFIRAGARFAGDLGMLDKMPTSLKGLKAVSKRFLPETGDDFVDDALVIAHRLVKDLDYEARSELASMLIQAMTDGLTLGEIADASAHLAHLQDRVKKQFVSYGSDSDRKKARTQNKRKRSMAKLLKQVVKKGPKAPVVIQDLDGRSEQGGRKLTHGNVLSKLIKPNSTAEDISKKLKTYSTLAQDATQAADNMLDGASRLHQMMKQDPEAAKYIKEFVLFTTGQ